MKRNALLTTAIALAILSAGCSGVKIGVPSQDYTTSDTGSADDGRADISAAFSDRDYEVGYTESESVHILLNGSSAVCDSSNVQISGSTVTITSEGTYILSGTLEDGMIIVDAPKEDKIQLVLDGAAINSEASAPLYILQTDKVFVTLAEGSENTLSNGGTFTTIDQNNIDAVIFSKEDITLNGSGRLTVNSPAGHGIISKDDLAITSGSYNITAASHGIAGNDAVKITNASVEIKAGKDGIRSENKEDTSLGYVFIESGMYTITSDGDGISASAYMQIQDGTYNITSGGGSKNGETHTDSMIGGWGRSSSTTQESDTSTKALKAAGSLLINNGTFTISSADDAVHAKAAVEINGGTFEIATGDDGFHSDDKLTINNGNINITESCEGLEGLCIEVNGGNILLKSSDDGMNAADGNDQGSFGGDMFGASADSYIKISGGVLNINADGDGIDSNGALNVTGGETYVAGPTGSGNGALDYASSATVTGGTFIAAGSSRMALSFSSAENQGAIMVTTSNISAGSTAELKNSAGEVLVAWAAEKPFNSIVISCPAIKQGETYTLTCGSYSTEITMDSLIYGSAGGMEGIGGHGGFGGGFPTPPDNFGGKDENRRPDRRFEQNFEQAAA